LQNKPVGVAMGGSPHHYLAVDTQLRQVLAWFGALVAPTSVYITGGDFRDGRLASDAARADLAGSAEWRLPARLSDLLHQKPLASSGRNGAKPIPQLPKRIVVTPRAPVEDVSSERPVEGPREAIRP
jgi:hypothetical protein